MKSWHRPSVLVLAACLAATFVPALAEQPEDASGGMEMTPEMQAALALAQPGPEHEYFKHFVGNWTYESKLWMDPSQPPMVTLGKSTGKLILGGRFLQTDYYGEFMGTPFEGLGIDGYDRLQEKFVTVWMDNTGTMMMQMEGSLDETGKVLTLRTEYIDPMTREWTKAKTVTTIVDDKSHKFEYFAPGPDGELHLVMEMIYTRR